MNTKQQLELLKEKRVKEILDDSSLTKIEKLRTIEEEKLWGYSRFINDEFPDWKQEIVELEKLKEGASYCGTISDSIFDPSTFSYEKYELVSYADALEQALENYLEDEDEDEGGENPLMTVITTRGSDIKLKKRYSETVDKVFEYACREKIVGFKNDW